MGDAATVFIIDDDDSVRRGLSRLLRAAGYCTHTFASAEALLSHRPDAHPACLVLDVQMPGLNGLQLQELLAAAGHHPPIIFLTGYATVPLSVRAMQMGAVAFLEKPVDAQVLLTAIEQVLGTDQHRSL